MPKILVVDDEPDVTDLLREFLEARHYDVTMASEGSGAMERAQHVNPRGMLLDIRIPGKSGLQVMEELKEYYPNLYVDPTPPDGIPEKRAALRFKVQLPVRVESLSPARDFRIHALTDDISCKGFRFHAQFDAQVGNLMTVHLLSREKSPTFARKARIVWLDDQYAPLICCGAEFLEISKWVIW